MTIKLGNIAGVILAGGRSSRMGGRDKALLPLAGRPLLAHVITRFAPQVAGLVLNANGTADQFAAFGLPVEPDLNSDYDGPLAGILAAMSWVRRTLPAATHLATATCDSPLIPTDLVARLAASVADKPWRIAQAGCGSDLHPVFGLFSLALADDLAAALDSGVRKVTEWTSRHPAGIVDFPFIEAGDELVDPFFNINTPEDLAAAERIAGVLGR